MTFWHPTPALPEIDHAVCFCAVGGQVLPDFFVWFADRGVFIGQTSTVKKGVRVAHDWVLKPKDVDFWAYKADLPPLPVD